jgi:hypothetical protein
LKDTNGLCRDRINATLEENLGRPSIYRQIAIFSGEISPIKLATAARDAMRKFRNDYKLVGFYNIIEWRRSKRDAESNVLIIPRLDQYKILIGQNIFFQPMITNSMHENSMNLAEYLNGILKLKPEDEHNDIPIEDIDDVRLLDSEILELATQHDLPIFISIDGGYDQNGAATTSVCILDPDICDTDAINGTEWQNRPAKILLIRSWCLPKNGEQKKYQLTWLKQWVLSLGNTPSRQTYQLSILQILIRQDHCKKGLKIKMGLRIKKW